MPFIDPSLLPNSGPDGSADPDSMPAAPDTPGAPAANPFAQAGGWLGNSVVPFLAKTQGLGLLQSAMAPSPEQMQAAATARALPEQAPQVPTSAQQPPPTGPQGMPPMMPGAPRMGMPGYDWQKGAANIDTATKGEQDALKKQADAETAAAAIRAQGQAQMAQQMQQQAQQSQTARDMAYQDVQAKQAALQKQADEADKMQVDPNHFWASRSGAQKAMASIGLALSQLGGAISGTKPVDMIHDAIDRDIDAQKANIANARAGISQKQNLLAENYKIFGNYQDAADMTKARMLDGLAKQVDAQAQTAATPAIAAKYQQMSAQLGGQAEQLQQQTFQRHAQNAYQNNMLALDRYKADLEAGKLGMQLAQQRRMGPLGMLPEKERDELAKQEAAVANLTKGARENAETLKELGAGDRARHVLNRVTGGLVSDSPAYGKLNSAQEAMAVNANLAQGIQTAQTEKQYENMREGANTPSSPAKGDAFAQSQVGAAREALARTYSAKLGIPIEQAQQLVEQRVGQNPWRADAVREAIRQKASK